MRDHVQNFDPSEPRWPDQQNQTKNRTTDSVMSGIGG